MFWWTILACSGPADDGGAAPDVTTDAPIDSATPGDTGLPTDSEPPTDTGPTTTETAGPATADTGHTAGPTADTGPVAPPCPAGLTGPTAETTTGCLVGRTADGVEGFVGIPYAEPPVGPLRWALPVPIAPWMTPLEAVEAGPVCIQSSGTLGGDLAPGEGEEDCLFLNVLRPEGTQPGDDLPVLFFVHGGGHTDGAGTQELYVGSSFGRPLSDPPFTAEAPDLAREAIVVTVNYRLAQLGFLSLPGLSEEDPLGVSGNQGLHDVLVALRWAHDNMEAFGGDPDALTLFGESAGSLTSCALLVSPEARGLFHSVMLQSGVCTGWTRTMAPSGTVESGYEQGARLAEALSCASASPADELACLRAKPVDEVMAVLSARQGFLGDGEAYGPVIEGHLLPDEPLAMMHAGDVADVPVVIGVNEDEGTVFAALAPVATPGLLDLTLRSTAALLGWDADGLVALYDPARYGDDAYAAWTAFIGDSSFVCPARQTAEVLSPHVDVHTYYFRRDSWILPALGAAHGLELSYVFGTGYLPAADRPLSERMVTAWTTVPTGAPRVEPIGPWPLVGDIAVEGGTWVQLDEEVAVVRGVRQEPCDWFRDQGFMVP